jgi:hypothetical protein
VEEGGHERECECERLGRAESAGGGARGCVVGAVWVWVCGVWWWLVVVGAGA